MLCALSAGDVSVIIASYGIRAECKAFNHIPLTWLDFKSFGLDFIVFSNKSNRRMFIRVNIVFLYIYSIYMTDIMFIGRI